MAQQHRAPLRTDQPNKVKLNLVTVRRRTESCRPNSEGGSLRRCNYTNDLKAAPSDISGNNNSSSSSSSSSNNDSRSNNDNNSCCGGSDSEDSGDANNARSHTTEHGIVCPHQHHPRHTIRLAILMIGKDL